MCAKINKFPKKLCRIRVPTHYGVVHTACGWHFLLQEEPNLETSLLRERFQEEYLECPGDQQGRQAQCKEDIRTGTR